MGPGGGLPLASQAISEPLHRLFTVYSPTTPHVHTHVTGMSSNGIQMELVKIY